MSAFQSTFDSLRAFPRRLSDAAREVRRTASLAGAAMLAALSLVLNQFTIAVSQFLEIGFSFLAAGTCAVLYGPWLAGLMGIVTDVAGFAASTYMRGVKFGFVSTTLLGQVDASVGGKNGVNVDGYKNMAGTFTQPQFVICDPALLRTLPEREFRAGLAEVVKAAIIADADLFGRIERTTFEALRTDTDLLSDAVSAAIRVKADIVERDERESGDRRKLNLGHTLAHAIEKASNRMNHGEAVAVGTALIAGAAVKLGALTQADCDRIVNVLTALGFDLTPPVEVKRLLKEVGKDKKNEDGMLRIVLPVGIGDCEVRPMTMDAFAALF